MSRTSEMSGVAHQQAVPADAERTSPKANFDGPHASPPFSHQAPSPQQQQSSVSYFAMSAEPMPPSGFVGSGSTRPRRGDELLAANNFSGSVGAQQPRSPVPPPGSQGRSPRVSGNAAAWQSTDSMSLLIDHTTGSEGPASPLSLPAGSGTSAVGLSHGGGGHPRAAVGLIGTVSAPNMRRASQDADAIVPVRAPVGGVSSTGSGQRRSQQHETEDYEVPAFAQTAGDVRLPTLLAASPNTGRGPSNRPSPNASRTITHSLSARAPQPPQSGSPRSVNNVRPTGGLSPGGRSPNEAAGPRNGTRPPPLLGNSPAALDSSLLEPPRNLSRRSSANSTHSAHSALETSSVGTAESDVSRLTGDANNGVLTPRSRGKCRRNRAHSGSFATTPRVNAMSMSGGQAGSGGESPAAAHGAASQVDMGSSLQVVNGMGGSQRHRSVAGNRSPGGQSLHTPLLSANSSFTAERTPSPLPSLGMQQYTIFKDQSLGSGASGTVYKGFDTMGGDHVAVKVAHMGSCTPQLIQEFESEFATLTQLSHEHIVHVRHLEVSQTASEASIVMEWMPGGSIRSILDRTKFRFHELVIRRYLREILLGMEYLHANDVLHRDVKSANLLVSGSGAVKVSDFGTCRMIQGASAASHTTATVAGTPAYMAPEVITKGRISAGADMWAIACTVIEMATGKVPWSHLRRDVRTGIPLMFHIGSVEPPNHHPPIPPHLSVALREMLERSFHMKPRKRPAATELLSHPYFSDATVSNASMTQRQHTATTTNTGTPSGVVTEGSASSFATGRTLSGFVSPPGIRSPRDAPLGASMTSMNGDDLIRLWGMESTTDYRDALSAHHLRVAQGVASVSSSDGDSTEEESEESDESSYAAAYHDDVQAGVADNGSFGQDGGAGLAVVDSLANAPDAPLAGEEVVNDHDDDGSGAPPLDEVPSQGVMSASERMYPPARSYSSTQAPFSPDYTAGHAASSQHGGSTTVGVGVRVESEIFTVGDGNSPTSHGIGGGTTIGGTVPPSANTSPPPPPLAAAGSVIVQGGPGGVPMIRRVGSDGTNANTVHTSSQGNTIETTVSTLQPSSGSLRKQDTVSSTNSGGDPPPPQLRLRLPTMPALNAGVATNDWLQGNQQQSFDIN